jgi:restriction system-associated AAA family ATPase
MMVDYGTNLEVLTANLLLGGRDTRRQLLLDTGVDDIHSCRCIVQLAGKGPAGRLAGGKGVKLTRELEQYIEGLRSCSTCHEYDAKSRTHTFDYWVNEETRQAFSAFWSNASKLFEALHKLAMLNDLALVGEVRTLFSARNRPRFASRVPEPPDLHKVFRFEQVRFRPRGKTDAVDYVSLSDGEHQLAQWLGTLAMQSFSNVLFLLDEPESHFNPKWRVKAVSRMIDLPTAHGKRSDTGKKTRVAEQECLLTTHAPFVPSDMHRDRVFIFSKVEGQIRVAHPDVETYGTTFDAILEACFDVVPPISEKSRSEIEHLRKSKSQKAIETALPKFGSSVQKAFLRDHLTQLARKRRRP